MFFLELFLSYIKREKLTGAVVTELTRFVKVG